MFSTFFEKLKQLLRKLVENRLAVVGLVFGVLVLILLIRVFDLQIVKGTEYYDLYVNTTKKEVTIPAMRGNIYDRNGVLLAGNKVVYSVTISDENYYAMTNGDFNEMILRLLRILERHEVKLSKTLPVSVDETGSFIFSGSESRIRQLIRDVYGTKKIQELMEQGVDAYQYDAPTVMKSLMTLYNFTSRWPNAENVSSEDAVKICNIRYQMAATAFTRYITTAVAKDVSEEVRAAVKENAKDLIGISVEESYERVYYNSECFSSILGYVGSITIEEIEELNAAGGNYSAGDMVGKLGIEAAYESYLQGKKGKKQIYVNNTGMVLNEKVTEEPKQGNNIYLSIDANMTIAAYNVAEQQLAGVVVSHLYKGTDYDPEIAYQKSDYKIPIRDVYFQTINNNILSIRDFANQNASVTEQAMNEKKQKRKAEVIRSLGTYLNTRSDVPLTEYTVYERAYIRYFYTCLNEASYFLRSEIDTQDDMYKAWQEGSVSFPAFLLYALKSGWVDTSKIQDQERYNNVDACYEYMVRFLLLSIDQDFGAFDKLIYDELIHTDVILGTDVAIALLEQGILTDSEETYEKLMHPSGETAYAFFESKIQSMELIPSQIALDPCSAGLVLTDPN
ncbi:MAG: hypothetical protein IK088_09515, partial [Lachnospiraceae bacterium]|nr:hypothetical protein [Lachnospiraceae bacterium]